MAAETSSPSSGVEETYVPSGIAPVMVAEGWQPHLLQLTLRNYILCFWEAQSESKGAHHHSPKAPTYGKLLSFRACKKTGYNKREEGQTTGRTSRLRARADCDPQRETHGVRSKRMSVRPGSQAGMRAGIPKACASL